MAGLVKKEIVKRLAMFTKNLNTDSISLSLFKGTGEFHDLDLDEEVLQDALDLPDCLQLITVRANKLSFRFQLMKYKSEPLTISIDRIDVKIELKDDLVYDGEEPASIGRQGTMRTKQVSAKLKAMLEAKLEKYSTMGKIGDGVTLLVNRVHVELATNGYSACLDLMNLCYRSTNPQWRPDQLSKTRLLHSSQEFYVLFKQLTCKEIAVVIWDTNMERAHPGDPTNRKSSNHTDRMELTIPRIEVRLQSKKRIADSVVLSTAKHIFIDDVAWQVTQEQMCIAGRFVSILKTLIDCEMKLKQELEDQRALEAALRAKAQQQQRMTGTPQNHLSRNSSNSSSQQNLSMQQQQQQRASPSQKAQANPADQEDPSEDTDTVVSALDVANGMTISMQRLALRVSTVLNEPALAMITLKNLKFDYFPNSDYPNPPEQWIEQLHASIPVANLRSLRCKIMQVRCGQLVVMPTTSLKTQHPDYLKMLTSGLRNIQQPPDSVFFSLDYCQYFLSGAAAAQQSRESLQRGRSGFDVPAGTLTVVVNPFELIFDKMNWLPLNELLAAVVDDVSAAMSVARAVYDPQGRIAAANLKNKVAHADDEPIGMHIELRMPTVILPPYSGHQGPEPIASLVLKLSASRVVITNGAKGTVDIAPLLPFFTRTLFQCPDIFPNSQDSWEHRCELPPISEATSTWKWVHQFQIKVDSAWGDVQKGPKAGPITFLDPVDLSLNLYGAPPDMHAKTNTTQKQPAERELQLIFLQILSPVVANVDPALFQYIIHLPEERLEFGSGVLRAQRAYTKQSPTSQINLAIDNIQVKFVNSLSDRSEEPLLHVKLNALQVMNESIYTPSTNSLSVVVKVAINSVECVVDQRSLSTSEPPESPALNKALVRVRLCEEATVSENPAITKDKSQKLIEIRLHGLNLKVPAHVVDKLLPFLDDYAPSAPQPVIVELDQCGIQFVETMSLPAKAEAVLQQINASIGVVVTQESNPHPATDEQSYSPNRNRKPIVAPVLSHPAVQSVVAPPNHHSLDDVKHILQEELHAKYDDLITGGADFDHFVKVQSGQSVAGHDQSRRTSTIKAHVHAAVQTEPVLEEAPKKKLPPTIDVSGLRVHIRPDGAINVRPAFQAPVVEGSSVEMEELHVRIALLENERQIDRAKLAQALQVRDALELQVATQKHAIYLAQERNTSHSSREQTLALQESETSRRRVESLLVQAQDRQILLRDALKKAELENEKLRRKK